MNRQEALSLARDARDLSKQGLELIHNLYLLPSAFCLPPKADNLIRQAYL
jgi:hypothetical protein